MSIDPLERLTNLVALLLEARTPLTFEQIVHELPGQYPEELVARRGAFERDKKMLREEGIPLELIAGEGGSARYRIDRRAYELPELGLTDDERAALAVAVATVHLGEAWGTRALTKVGDPGGARAARAAVAVLGSDEVLPVLFAAQAARAPVRFGYRGTTRTVDPYGLLARDGFWYVVGRDHRSGEQRTFRVDRFDDTPVAGGEAGSFEVPARFDPSAAMPADPKMIGDGTVLQARVEIDAVRAATVVADLGDHAIVEWRDDRSAVVTLPVRNREAFRSWVLGLLDHAEVLGPEVLRSDVIAWLEGVER